jgi:hypothetical protein
MYGNIGEDGIKKGRRALIESLIIKATHVRFESNPIAPLTETGMYKSKV